MKYYYLVRCQFLGRDFIYSTSGYIVADSEYHAYLTLSDQFPTLIEVVTLQVIE